MPVETIGICYPRPRRAPRQYSGGFNQYVERRLLKEAGYWPPDQYKILHPFGGMAEYGLRVDIQRFVNDVDIRPDVIGDAHCLPFPDNTFDVVILDPPFSADYAETKWNTPPPKFKNYSTEASRVAKEGGIVIVYHWLAMPPVVNTHLVKRILIEGRRYQHARIVHFHRKDTEAYRRRRPQTKRLHLSANGNGMSDA